MKAYTWAICLLGLSAPSLSAAQSTAARLRVVDVGPGLCVVITVPGDHAMLYDAGRGGDRCTSAVRELVPSHQLDLVVLSHSDSDHIRELPTILAENRVRTIIHPGDPRGPLVDGIRLAIEEEHTQDGAEVFNLAAQPVAFGTPFPVGEATAIFVAGWSNGNETPVGTDPPLDDAEGEEASMRNNALSIVIRFVYRGHSVLLTGDTVGRFQSPDDSLCQYAERRMAENASSVRVRSDVLVGQHHGADNSSSNCFIRAVRPKFVVFSAGNEYRHPRQSTADRFVANGLLASRMFRTDRGDNEGGQGRTKEWIFGAIAGCADEPGDDDVEITLPRSASARVRVRYRTASHGC